MAQFRNFKLVKNGLDLENIRAELMASDLWVNMDASTKRIATHANTERIQLRTNKPVRGMHYHNIHESIDLAAWHALPHTRAFVKAIVGELGGELGRVRVTNLRGGAEIVPHIDVGEYCSIRDRYHLVINSDPGTLFAAGDETVVMHENEFWWFDNKKQHCVKNLGSKPRMHLVFDIKPVNCDAES